jgi:hypothetical protein
LGLILVLCGLGLLQTILILNDLILNFGRSDFGEKLASLDMIADIDKTLQNIAARARIDVGLLEAQRRRRQCDVYSAEMLSHVLDPHGRGKVGLLLGGIRYLPVLLIVVPYAQRERAHEKHNGGEPQQPAPGPAGP